MHSISQKFAPVVGHTAFWVAEHDARIRRTKFKKCARPPRPKFFKMHGRAKNQNVIIMSNGGLLYERIPNLGAEFKSDNI